MPCLSPFKKFIEDLFDAYDASGFADSLDEFMTENAFNIIDGNPVEYGVYDTPEYCCPSCDAIDDPCGNFYFLGNVTTFLELAVFKSWVTNPGSAPCCYNFMGEYNTILSLQSSLCWTSIPRCCNEFDACFKTFETVVPINGYNNLLGSGVVEYGTIDDPDNICFLKTFLEDRYDNRPDKILLYLQQILSAGLLIVCPIDGDEVWVLTYDAYKDLCSL